MRCLALLSLFCLISTAAGAEPVTTIRNNGSSANRIDIAIMGDGYTAAEIASGKYAADLDAAVNALFAEDPFSDYRNYFNVHRIDVTSVESGASKIARGIVKNTALGAYYDCEGVTRLICVDQTKVQSVLTRSISSPNARDFVLVIVNDSEYGGSGGSYGVSSINAASADIVRHEMGHTLGLLADEYGGPPPPNCVLSPEPPAANATLQTVRSLIKWNAWIDPTTPIPTTTAVNGIAGLFQGADYCDTGKYRPTFNSKMRTLNVPFYQVNSEQLVRRVYNFVSPIDAVVPTSTSVTVPTGATQLFSVATPSPLSHTLTSEWRLDGVLVSTGPSYSASRAIGVGSHSLELRVYDATALVRNDSAGVLRTSRTWAVGVARATSSEGDFDGDGKSEIGVYRPSTGFWYVRQSSSGFGYGDYLTYQWGAPGDLPIQGDFDGDGKAELAVYRPSTGEWYIRYSSTGYSYTGYGVFQWGIPGDVPLAGDFDGDGKADIAVYRPSTGYWYIRYSSTGYSYTGYGVFQWGIPGDVPLAGDFDGDGKADIAVYRPSTGYWYIRYSSTGYSYTGYGVFQWGIPGDTPLSTDFDGDGKADIAVYRPSTGYWYIRYSSTGFSYAYGAYQWGIPGDEPVMKDFDGDGKTELTVYRPSTGDWYIRYSSLDYSYTYGTYQWGIPNDLPLQR